MMGCNDSIDENCYDDEFPYHEVNVSEFEIDVAEVTQGQYRACVEHNGSCPEPVSSPTHEYCNWSESDREDHPANCISWSKASAYCEWVGKRLCSESEWEKAARGTDERIYPWGNEEPSCDRTVMTNGIYGCGEDRTWPVGSKPIGVHGLHDMAGNVWEWVEDDYHNTYEGAPSGGGAWIENPRTSKIIRGGGLGGDNVNLRVSERYNCSFSERGYIGVRCCRNAP